MIVISPRHKWVNEIFNVIHVWGHPHRKSIKCTITQQTPFTLSKYKVALTLMRKNLVGQAHVKGLFHLWLTHWCCNKMASNFQTTFSKAFSWMKMYKLRSRFHWSLFSSVELTIFQHWFRWWLGTGQATSHYLNQRWLVYWSIPGIYATLPQWHWGWVKMAIILHTFPYTFSCMRIIVLVS